MRTSWVDVLGRFSAQMANDVKNPLAAIQGAAQWLAEDSRVAAHSAEHRAFVALVLEQASRLERVVGAYARLEGLGEGAPSDLHSLAEEIARVERESMPPR